jgi:hypothetical protein
MRRSTKSTFALFPSSVSPFRHFSVNPAILAGKRIYCESEEAVAEESREKL